MNFLKGKRRPVDDVIDLHGSLSANGARNLGFISLTGMCLV